MPAAGWKSHPAVAIGMAHVHNRKAVHMKKATTSSGWNKYSDTRIASNEDSEKRFNHDWGAAAYRKTYSRRAYAAYGKAEDREVAE
jgi:hypothetical protein